MRDIVSHVLPVERIVFTSPVICAGLFRCGADDPDFPGGRPCSAHSVVFPREAVWIQQERGRRFVGDPTVATLYNRGETYRRWSIGGRSDRCDWLAFPDALLRDAVRQFAPADADVQAGPLRPCAARVSARLYAAQRTLFTELTSGGPSDALLVEERALNLLSAVLRSAHGASRPASGRERPSVTRRTVDAVERVRRCLALDLRRRVSLAELAADTGMSPFHVCRVFRSAVGMTISEYRTERRVRAALEPVLAGEDLSQTALAFGFDSHSHFTSAFHRVFGVPPSVLRRRITRAHLTEIRRRNSGDERP